MLALVLLSIVWPRYPGSSFGLEPQDARMPLTWDVVGPEGGLVDLIMAKDPDTLIAVAWPNLWLSTDGGGSWTDVAHYWLFGTKEGTMTRSGAILIFQDSDTLWRSTDWGTTWLPVMADSSLGEEMALTHQRVSTVYLAGLDTIGSQIVIYKSTDNGANWSMMDSINLSDPASTNLYDISLCAGNPDMVYLAYGTSGTSNDSVFLRASTNGGSSWMPVSSFDGQVYPDVRSILVSPAVPTIVFMALSVNTFPTSGVLKFSTNMGNSWTNVDSAKLYTHLGLYQDSLLLAASAIPEGIKRFNLNASNDTAWIYADEAVLFTEQVGGSVLLAATCGLGVVRSLTDGVSWDERNTGLYGVWSSTPNQISSQGDVVYFLDQRSGRLYKSTDGGQTWSRNSFNPVFDPGDFGMAGTAMHAATQDLVYISSASFGSFATFFRSTDGGASWTPVSLINAPLLFNIADMGGDTLYGLGLNLVTQVPGIYKSIDRGDGWSLVYTYPLIFNAFYPLGDVEVSPWGSVFFTDTLGVLYSDDRGTTWNRMSPNLELAWWMDSTASQVFFTSTDTLFEGVWDWDNSSWHWRLAPGNSYQPSITLPDVSAEANNRLTSCWLDMSLGYPASVVAYDTVPYSTWAYDTIALYIPSFVDLTSDAILLGTLGGPIMRADFQGTGLSERVAQRPYLNAFVSGSKLHLQLGQQARVLVRLYDPAGRLVKLILDEERPTGESWIELPSAPSGVYMLKIDAGASGSRVLKWVNTRR